MDKMEQYQKLVWKQIRLRDMRRAYDELKGVNAIESIRCSRPQEYEENLFWALEQISGSPRLIHQKPIKQYGIYKDVQELVLKSLMNEIHLLIMNIERDAKDLDMPGSSVKLETIAFWPDVDPGESSQNKAESPSKTDHPAHYNNGSIECIDAILSARGVEATKEFCICNAMKYLWRLGHKDDAKQEAEKAKWYLEKYLSL